MRERLHLMAKDWRYIRGWAVGCWALTIAAWAVLDVAAHPTLRYPAGLVHVIALLLPFVATARLFLLDPALGSTSFWVTRPIDRTSLLVSKLAVAFGAVLGPCLLLSVLPLALRGLGLTPRDYGLALAAMLVRYLFLAWFVLLVAAVARGLAEAALLAAVFAVILAVLSYLSSLALTSTSPDEASFLVVLALLLLPIQMLVFLRVLYQTRRLAPAAVVLALSGVAILALKDEWRWNLMPLARREAPRPPGGSRTDWPIRVELLETRGGVLKWRPGSGQSYGAQADIRIHGLEPGVSLIQTGYETTVDDASGVRRSHRAEIPLAANASARAWMPPPTTSLGCLNGSAEGTVQVVQLQHAGAFLEDWRGIRRVSGRLRFAVVRWSVSQRAPADGGELQFPGGRVVGVRQRASEGASALTLRYERLGLMPFSSPSRPVRPELYLPASADCLALDDVTVAGGAGLTLPLGVEEESARQWSRRGRFREVLDRALPASVEMLFFGREVLGSLEVPFVVD